MAVSRCPWGMQEQKLACIFAATASLLPLSIYIHIDNVPSIPTALKNCSCIFDVPSIPGGQRFRSMLTLITYIHVGKKAQT